MRALGYEIRKQEVVLCFQEVDKDIGSSLSFEDFLRILTPRLRDKSSKEEIFKIFRLFDEDQTGRISFKNLKKISAEIGESLSDDEL